MSKSFSIDLKQFTLPRPIGAEGKILYRPADAYDVYQTLSDLGYNGFNDNGYVSAHKCGLIPDLETSIESMVMGVPTSAVVKIKRMGNNKRFLFVSLTY